MDSSVLIDVLTHDPQWEEWSTSAIESAADEGAIGINPVIYAEVSVGFDSFEALEAALPPDSFLRLPLPGRRASQRAVRTLPIASVARSGRRHCRTSISERMLRCWAWRY